MKNIHRAKELVESATTMLLSIINSHEKQSVWREDAIKYLQEAIVLLGFDQQDSSNEPFI